MNSFIEMANELAGRWLDGMWVIVWQSTVLAAIVFSLTLCIRRVSATVRFWLWMLVPLRLLVMPLITISLPLLPAMTQPESTYIEPATVERQRLEYPAYLDFPAELYAEAWAELTGGA